MVSVTSLPYDVWVLIIENLALPHLSTLYKAVAGIGNDADIGTITTLHARGIICRIIASGITVVQATIESNQQPCLRPPPTATTPVRSRRVSSLRHKVKRTKFHHYNTKLNDTEFKREFERISASKFKMILTSKNGESRPSYDPRIYGGEPAQPTSLRLLFFPNHRSRTEGQLLELKFKIGERALPDTVGDMSQTPLYPIRTISQTLQLQWGVWIGQVVRERTEIPKCWFNILGDRINVTATFKKMFREPNPSAEQFSACRSALQEFSVTFAEISLPKSPRLLALFPSEIVNLEMIEDVVE